MDACAEQDLFALQRKYSESECGSSVAEIATRICEADRDMMRSDESNVRSSRGGKKAEEFYQMAIHHHDKTVGHETHLG